MARHRDPDPDTRARTGAVLRELREAADPSRKPGMARVGIDTERALGVSIPNCRRIARGYRGDHPLALALWATEVHEARIVAALVDDPALVTPDQMEAWVGDLDSWDICDQLCSNLFGETRGALATARRWCGRPEEFVRRAGFTLIAERAVHAKELPDATFVRLLPVIRRGASDDRNYVKKAVNWALRQIGKRNLALNAAAIDEAERILAIDTPSTRWIARDALRELRSEAVQARLRP